MGLLLSGIGRESREWCRAVVTAKPSVHKAEGQMRVRKKVIDSLGVRHGDGRTSILWQLGLQVIVALFSQIQRRISRYECTRSGLRLKARLKAATKSGPNGSGTSHQTWG